MVMYKKFTLAEAKYDQLVKLCFALINFHIGLYPLRAEDLEHYRKTLSRYVSQACHQRDRRTFDPRLPILQSSFTVQSSFAVCEQLASS